MTLGLGIIGMGVQGRRMLSRLAEHGRMRAVAAWDPDPARLEGLDPGAIMICPSAAGVLRAPGLDCVYVASPPASHLDHANRAFDAGLAVFCEKPLAVDFAAARQTIARIEREGLRGAVNFSLASSVGLAGLHAAIEHSEIGALQSIEIEVAFKEWPRPWQAGAGPWLSQRREGGFTREVLSHFIFVLQRVLRKARVEDSMVILGRQEGASETGIAASLRCGDVAVSVRGTVSGEVADFNRFALVCENGTMEFRDWMATRQRGGASGPDAQPGGRPGYLRQLDELAAFIEGRPHALPDFAEALAVQETIEAMLAGESKVIS